MLKSTIGLERGVSTVMTSRETSIVHYNLIMKMIKHEYDN